MLRLAAEHKFSTLPEKTPGVVDCGQVLRQQRRQGVRLTSVPLPRDGGARSTDEEMHCCNRS